MSLEFAIIPFDDSVIHHVYDLQTKLNNTVNLYLNTIVDTNFNTSFSSRINKWKRQEKDVITIDKEYSENNIIIVRFCDNDSKPQAMSVDEFIDLIASYEDEDEDNDNTDNTNVAQNGGCIIM